jgi:hypothetical protein
MKKLAFSSLGNERIAATNDAAKLCPSFAGWTLEGPQRISAL